MPQTVGKLTALRVTRLAEPGVYPDGAGLYLQVTGDGKRRVKKSWLFRFSINGRRREMGLGSLAALSLADAREAASECRKQRHDGIDPIEARRAGHAQAALEMAKAITFKDAAERYVAAHKVGWRNAKHAAQWTATLQTYAYPIFGSLPVAEVDTALAMKVLEPIWNTKSETATRVRGRIEAILDWAKARGYRDGENPARWRGHLDNLLPPRAKVQKVRHHAALPYAELPSFLTALRQRDGVAARALEFTILTAARSGETIGARWSEIDLIAATWTVPADRMKGGQEHRVPLSAGALGILNEMPVLGRAVDDFIFRGARRGKSLSNMTMMMVLRRMDREDLTVHGFRSTFRHWTAERTNYSAEVAEMALAHAIGDRVEAAYRCGDLFEKRRRLMDAWAGYCAGAASKSGAVVSIAAKGRQ